MCLNISQKEGHPCLENKMKTNCPICFEDLFTSREASTTMTCGHPIHSSCFTAYLRSGHMTCPFCSKTVVEMSQVNTAYDRLIEVQPMPEEFKDSQASILCSDCQSKSTIKYHFLAQKCPNCGSYNTRITATHNMPSVDIQNDNARRMIEESNRRREESTQVVNDEGDDEEDEVQGDDPNN